MKLLTGVIPQEINNTPGLIILLVKHLITAWQTFIKPPPFQCLCMCRLCVETQPSLHTDVPFGLWPISIIRIWVISSIINLNRSDNYNYSTSYEGEHYGQEKQEEKRRGWCKLSCNTESKVFFIQTCLEHVGSQYRAGSFISFILNINICNIILYI